MQKILLTGATGFLGSQVLKHLSTKKVKIIVVSRNKKNLKDTYQNITEVIHTEDFFNENDLWLEKICTGIDIVIHCAWYAEPGKYLQSSSNEACRDGTIRLAKASINSSVKRFIGIGSCFEYDLFTKKKIDVDFELKPLTPYAIAKVETFKTLTKLFSNLDIEFLWARMFYLYGEREDPRRLIPILRKNLREKKKVSLTEGSEVRDYLNINEAGKVISNLSFSSAEGAFNVCSGKEVTIREIAEKIAKEYDALDLLEFGTYKMNAFESNYIVGKRSKV